MSLHEAFLRALSCLPPVRQRLSDLVSRFFPILEPTFQENRYAQLLTLFSLDCTERGKLPAAQRLLSKLEPICDAGSDAEKALWCVATGYFLDHCGQRNSAVSAFEEAAAHGHHFPLPYLVTAEFHLLNTKFYDIALSNYDQAINCIYRYPPLDEAKQHLIAQAHAGMAICLIMMHRTEEAAAALEKAEAASHTEEYQHARALLCAIKGDTSGAEAALAAFRELDQKLSDHVAWHVRMILDGTHIHFNVRPVKPQLAQDFWAWFREKEAEFQPLLEKGDADSCGTMLADHINTLVPDEEDMMNATIELQDGQPTIILTACYSRSYAAMIDAIAAACPEDLSQRWKLIIHP